MDNLEVHRKKSLVSAYVRYELGNIIFVLILDFIGYYMYIFQRNETNTVIPKFEQK